MSECMVMVRFETGAGQREAFLELVEAHAQASVAEEPGCRRFDVVVPEDRTDLVMLYEVYTDAEALEAHKATERLARFNAKTEPLLRSKEIVVGRLSPGSPAPKA